MGGGLPSLPAHRSQSKASSVGLLHLLASKPHSQSFRTQVKPCLLQVTLPASPTLGLFQSLVSFDFKFCDLRVLVLNWWFSALQYIQITWGGFNSPAAHPTPLIQYGISRLGATH